MRNTEDLFHRTDQRLRQRRRLFLKQQRPGPGHQLCRDRVVFLRVTHHLRDARLERLDALAHHHRLTLHQRDRLAVVRVRQLHAGEQFRMLVKKIGMTYEVIRDVLNLHGSAF